MPAGRSTGEDRMTQRTSRSDVADLLGPRVVVESIHHSDEYVEVNLSLPDGLPEQERLALQERVQNQLAAATDAADDVVFTAHYL